MITETDVLIKVLEVYSQTNKFVSQGFFQALCIRAVEELKDQAEHIKLLNQCDDSSTEVIGKMDDEIKILKDVIERQKETIKHQGNANEERHNILCGIKEEIDEYFGKNANDQS